MKGRLTGEAVSRNVRASLDPDSGQYNMAEEIQNALDNMVDQCMKICTKRIVELRDAERYRLARRELVRAREEMRRLSSVWTGTDMRGDRGK